MKYHTIPLLLALTMPITGCNLDIETDIPEDFSLNSEPIIIYFCVDGWLWDKSGMAILNQLGQQETCSEGY